MDLTPTTCSFFLTSPRSHPRTLQIWDRRDLYRFCTSRKEEDILKVRVGISAVLKCRCRRVRSCSKSATQLHQPLRVEVDCLIMGLCFMVLGAHLESARISPRWSSPPPPLPRHPPSGCSPPPLPRCPPLRRPLPPSVRCARYVVC